MKKCIGGNMKKIISILLAMGLTLGLAGCGADKAEPVVVPEESTEEAAEETAEETEEEAPASESTEVHTITLADGSVYPSGNITLIIPWSAGGNTDLYSRKLASIMETYLGTSIVVMNTNGGGGQVGYNTLIGASADGYTMCATSNSMILAPYTGSGTFVPYDSVKHLAMWGSSACCIAVPVDSPYENISDFIEAAAANPEDIRLSNSGIGATWHSAALTLENLTGAKFSHIPYDSGTDAVTAAAGGHVEAVICGVSECSSLVEAGNLRVLAVTGDEACPLYPDVPTFEESGISGMWGGFNDFIVPAETPQEVCDLLIEAMEYAVNTDEWKEFYEAGGQGWIWKTGEELDTYYSELDTMFGEIYTQN